MVADYTCYVIKKTFSINKIIVLLDFLLRRLAFSKQAVSFFTLQKMYFVVRNICIYRVKLIQSCVFIN